jgi:hypothetical protein
MTAAEDTMRERLARAISRNALLAAGFAAIMIYRFERAGWPRRRVILLIYLGVLLGLTLLVATALQVRSRVDRWTWTTLGAFVFSLVGVSVVMIAALWVAMAFR